MAVNNDNSSSTSSSFFYFKQRDLVLCFLTEILSSTFSSSSFRILAMSTSRLVIKRRECNSNCLIIGTCSSLLIFRFLIFLTRVISVMWTNRFYCRVESLHEEIWAYPSYCLSDFLTIYVMKVDIIFLKHGVRAIPINIVKCSWSPFSYLLLLSGKQWKAEKRFYVLLLLV